MTAWTCFAAVVGVQLAVFAAVAAARRVPADRALRLLAAALVFGVPYGLAFDLIAGRAFDVFAYRLSTTVPFLILNGALSYGLAAATIWVLPIDRAPAVRPPIWQTAVAGAVLAAALALIAVSDTPLPTVIGLGAAILAAGELAGALAGRTGPGLAVLAGRPGPGLRLWGAAVAIALVYEAANALCPVWAWTPLPGLPGPWTHAAIVLLGYVVLLHPAWVAGQRVRARGRRRSSPA
jgi:hypothetical protein